MRPTGYIAGCTFEDHWSQLPHAGQWEPHRASSCVFPTRPYQSLSTSILSETIRWPPGSGCSFLAPNVESAISPRGPRLVSRGNRCLGRDSLLLRHPGLTARRCTVSGPFRGQELDLFSSWALQLEPHIPRLPLFHMGVPISLRTRFQSPIYKHSLALSYTKQPPLLTISLLHEVEQFSTSFFVVLRLHSTHIFKICLIFMWSSHPMYI